MSRTQSPSRDSALTLSLLAEKVLQITDAINDLRIQVTGIRVDKHESEQRQEVVTETIGLERLGTTIKLYNKALHLIPEFDGSNVESFIGHIQYAVKRVEPDQHADLLCSIIAQKMTGRAKGAIRLDIISSFMQLYEKLRFLYGKAEHLTALEVQRDTCIQRHNETVDEFITRFVKIHDDIITTLNSQRIGITSICLREELYQERAIEAFRQNIKQEISDHLYYFELDTLNQAFSKPRTFEGELQLQRLRTQRSEGFKKSPQQKQFQRPQFKECNYCKKRGHEEKECRTKVFHQQRNQQNFRERRNPSQPPGPASHLSRITGQETDQHLNEDFTRDQEGRTSEHLELD